MKNNTCIVKKCLIACAIVWSLMVVMACSTEEVKPAPQPPSPQPSPELPPVLNRTGYVIDSIKWYETSTNHKEAYYKYDETNRLISRTIHSTYQEWNGVKTSTLVNTIEYRNGHVCRITETITPDDGFQHPDQVFLYDSLGRMIRWEYGNDIKCFAYHNGRIDSIYHPNNSHLFSSLEYDSFGNVVKEHTLRPTMNEMGDSTGQYEISTCEYEYDNNPRPNFNTDEAIMFDPVFGMGSGYPTYVRILSSNNLTHHISGHETWEYDYNAQGLPKTMYHQYADLVPTYRSLWTFYYRKIQ